MTTLYIHIEKEEIEIGEYDPVTLKAIKFASYPSNNLPVEDIAGYLIGDKQQNILYYVHAWLGNLTFYNKKSIRKLRLLEGIDKMIAIRWENEGFSYISNWFKAPTTGKKIADLFEVILSRGNSNILLCHSMGHSLLVGLAKKLLPGKIYFKVVLFAGADLPDDIFYNELNLFPSNTNHLVVYTHQKDWPLHISTWLHKKKRLGILSLQQHADFSYINNLVITDITYWKGSTAMSPSNHIYFKEHNGVRKDINLWIKKAISVELKHATNL